MSASNAQPGLWAVLAAAGVGSRMQCDVAKQYLPLRGKRVIDWSIQRLFDAGVEHIAVVVSAQDSVWPELTWHTDDRISTAVGGDNRAESVINGLRTLQQRHASRTPGPVLVHDAARPCVRSDDIRALVGSLAGSSNGGLLAMPSIDTLKRVDDNNRIRETIDRASIWRAATPQYFDCNQLLQALLAVRSEGVVVTDESSAMEMRGHRPVLVTCQPDNLKVTTSGDLAQAEHYLQQQEQTCA